jgi:hypothetical protein
VRRLWASSRPRLPAQKQPGQQPSARQQAAPMPKRQAAEHLTRPQEQQPQPWATVPQQLPSAMQPQAWAPSMPAPVRRRKRPPRAGQRREQQVLTQPQAQPGRKQGARASQPSAQQKPQPARQPAQRTSPAWPPWLPEQEERQTQARQWTSQQRQPSLLHRPSRPALAQPRRPSPEPASQQMPREAAQRQQALPAAWGKPLQPPARRAWSEPLQPASQLPPEAAQPQQAQP